MSAIIYTHTDEAPMLATYSWLPIVRQFVAQADIELTTADISLAARILASFPECLPSDQQQFDDLAALGKKVKQADANIIKLPNISASVPQLTAAIAELQKQGFAVPDYPSNPKTDQQKDIRARYGKVLGSAVNPVLREGNSDRRVAAPVKTYAQQNPHSMGQWQKDSQSHVAHMQAGDFYGSEQSVTLQQSNQLRIEFVDAQQQITLLKDSIAVDENDVVDSSRMSCQQLANFYQQQLQDAKQQGVLWSLHLKATMMKVSDPILFGHGVKAFFAPIFAQFGDELAQVGANPNNGWSNIVDSIEKLPADRRDAIHQAIEQVYGDQPELAMVDSSRGITNLHFPNDVIIDASMPAMIRAGGKMWGKDDQLHDVKAVIPDRSYAGIYQAAINFCREHGAFDPATMGSVANVGLMAKKAEEYGSHDKTFECAQAGTMRVVNQQDEVLMEHTVESGDIWRMCVTRGVSITDWVKLAVTRARLTNTPALFWLDRQRSHDRELIKQVEHQLPRYDLNELDIRIVDPVDAINESMGRARQGQDTISVTGNVLRDYLTDLFPILELGTSAKMLSIVPLLAGGGLFETGAGGSAPKHVQQLVQENHLRWDSLGEFLALAVSLESLARQSNNSRAALMASALDQATTKLLNHNQSPSRKVGELDNRGSHFYMAWYWAQALAEQQQDRGLAQQFQPIANQLAEQKEKILQQLSQVQGQQVDIGGYYRLDAEKTNQVMRPSDCFNRIVDNIGQ